VGGKRVEGSAITLAGTLAAVAATVLLLGLALLGARG
jgi:hypothetical protein